MINPFLRIPMISYVAPMIPYYSSSAIDNVSRFEVRDVDQKEGTGVKCQCVREDGVGKGRYILVL